MYDLAELVVVNAAILRAEVVRQLRDLRVRQANHRTQRARQDRHKL